MPSVGQFTGQSKPFALTAARGATARDWRPYAKNTLRGFFSLELPSGMVIHGLTLHIKADSRWVGMPAQKYTTAEGATTYTPILEFTDRHAADRFRDLAIAALVELGVEA